MEENTQLPKEVVEEIKLRAEAVYSKLDALAQDVDQDFGLPMSNKVKSPIEEELTAYATKLQYSEERNSILLDEMSNLSKLLQEKDDKLHQANETIKVLEYDNNKLKGEVEGLKNAVEELRTKYDNIFATESGHESKTENVWQSGYAAGHETGYERGKRETQPGALWVKGAKGFPVMKRVVAKFKHYDDPLRDWVVGFASSSTGETITFDWGVSSITLDIKHERWDMFYWLDESAVGREEIDIDELWDEHAEYIDDNIDELVRWAGSIVVTREQFNKMMGKLKQQKEK